MADGHLEGMQTFDGELEKLINAGLIDKETGLSYATNRTNLQLRLETGGKAPPRRHAFRQVAAPRRRGRPGRRRPSWTT